jgi:hypothetical protein
VVGGGAKPGKGGFSSNRILIINASPSPESGPRCSFTSSFGTIFSLPSLSASLHLPHVLDEHLFELGERHVRRKLDVLE